MVTLVLFYLRLELFEDLIQSLLNFESWFALDLFFIRLFYDTQIFVESLGLSFSLMNADFLSFNVQNGFQPVIPTDYL